MPDKTKVDAARRRLVDAAARKNLSLAHLSREVLERGRTYLGDYVNKGSPEVLDYEDRVKLTQILDLELRDLSPSDDGSPSQPSSRSGVTLPGATSDLQRHVRPATPMLTGARDVPIRGYAKGGENAWFWEQGALIGMAYRPAILEGAREAFAIEVWDNSMAPALKHGYLVYVHPRKQAVPGDEVLITLMDGQALVKELVRRTEKFLILRQYNPAEEIRIEQAKVKEVHLIVESLRVRS